MIIRAATGHRPEKLGGHDQKTRRALGALAVEALHDDPCDEMIVGMALGWDQAVASACVTLGIPFTAALPFRGQPNRWPEAAKARYFRLLEAAKTIVVIGDEPPFSEHQVNILMQRRNEWMVDRAEGMLALHDGSWGGTFNCLVYAKKRGVPVTNLWQKWSMPEDVRQLLGV